MKMKLIIPQKKDLKDLNYDYIDTTIDQYYRPVQGYFMRKRLELALTLMKNKKVDRILDVGYGGGTFMPTLASLCNELHGIDTLPNPKDVESILNKQNVKVKLITGSILKTPYKKNYFDTIVCISVLEHFKGRLLNNAINAMYKILKPGGYLVLGFPVKNPITNYIIKNILNFEPDEIHPSGHKQIIKAINEEVKIDKIIHYFPFVPLDFSLYCVVRAKKNKYNVIR